MADRKQYQRDWAARNAAKVSHQHQTWREQNPERNRELKQNWKKRHPEQARKDAKEAYARDPQKFRDKTAAWRAKYPIRALLTRARQNAKVKGLKFTIKEADLLPLPKVCPVFGIPLIYSTTGRTGGRVDGTASMDRIENDKGYEKGNVAVVSWLANRIKYAATLDQLKALVKYMERTQ